MRPLRNGPPPSCVSRPRAVTPPDLSLPCPMKIESAPSPSRRTPPPASSAAPAALRAFLTGLIDYAGLFPPARLSMEEAVPNFAAYSEGADAWMLARFICPAARLADLDAYTDLFRPGHPFEVSALGSGGDAAEGFLRGIEDDLAAVREAEAQHEGRLRVTLYETRLPNAVAEAGQSTVADVLVRAADQFDEAEHGVERVHYEVAFAGDWRRSISEAVAALGRHEGPVPVGFKIRCGGMTPNAFPTPEQVAFVLARCRDAGVPFKATAGLHHPVRHYDRATEVMQHGFFNVFGAGVLAHALELSEPALRQVLRNEDPKAFAFDDGGFAFQDLRIATEQVRAAREAFATSYGSCSFDEPREDLRAAGLL